MKTIPLIALAAVLALTACKATAPTTTANPFASRAIYPDPAQARTDLAAALNSAAATHKRILLDFGGNWCPDCKVLDIYFHDPANRAILEADYVLVHVNIGYMDANLDIAQQYEVPLRRGVPALAVLDEHGKLLFSQKSGEFEAMRRMESAEVTKFLVQWEPEKPCSTVMVNC
ncbi:MAG: thioredoxin family protein [Terracidiphilus sp.]|jgi:thiol:disulfide interchange protein